MEPSAAANLLPLRSRRVIGAVVFVALHLVLAPQAGAQDGLAHFSVTGCSARMTSKIWTALHYLENVVADNDDFLYCLSDARGSVEAMVTRQEFSSVGPYVPCNGTDPEYREPATAYINPGQEVSRARLYLEDAFASDYPSAITIACTSYTHFTAQVSSEYTPGHRNGYTIMLGYDPQWTRPAHQPLTPSTLPDIGPTFDYIQAEGSYPVDELAGIIAHEILHTHGYEHGESSSNQCNYTAWDCTGSSSTASCRANSMNEIFEACVSEVVERSIATCSSARWANRHPIHQDGRRRLPLVEYGTCRSIVVRSDARDRWGQSRTEFEMEIDRYGGDYSAITTTSAAACQLACIQDWQCYSFTYLGAINGCYLKASIPPPSRRAGAVSAVVRVNDDSGQIIDSWDRYANTTSSGAIFQTISTTAADCEQRCLVDIRCRVYTHASGQCSLRSARGAFSALAGSTAVEVRTPADLDARRVTLYNGHYEIVAGYTLSSLGDGGYERCMEVCHGDPACVGFNYFPDNHCDFDVCDPSHDWCFATPAYRVAGGVGYYR